MTTITNLCCHPYHQERGIPVFMSCGDPIPNPWIRWGVIVGLAAMVGISVFVMMQT